MLGIQSFELNDVRFDRQEKRAYKPSMYMY
jgi:hypothetical protein